MKTRRTKEDRIRYLVSRWKPRLLLNHWSVDIEFAAEQKPAEKSGHVHYAEVVLNDRYTECKLIVYPSLFNKPFHYQRATIVHELSHITTRPISKLLEKAASRGVFTQTALDDAVEGITEAVAKIVLSAHSTNKKDFQL